MDLDSHIDVDRLRALDLYVRERIEWRIDAARDLQFCTGPFLLKDAAPRLPGSRMVYLSRSVRDEDYYDLNRTELWEPSDEAAAFPELMDFIGTLPFKGTARMMIIYDESGRAVSAHRDHASAELCHEFIWFRTNLDKPFYMLNPETGERLDVAGHSAWFDTVNQYHGADHTGALSFSIRVDGVFSDEFRAMIPFPDVNRSSAPSVWATATA
ncbi:hypothetical protein [Allosphingosinicella sp.]|jgi:hypothetical protein|uniref:hypothetical protein n=1 Tax=Allosphingosinicella sp. TaxID=2823234 RepID=UPI003D705C4F